MRRLWGQLNLISKTYLSHISKPNTGMEFYSIPFVLYLFTSEQRLFLLVCMIWLRESPWYNQSIIYILTYLEYKTIVGRQIYNIQNAWYEDMSSEAKGGIGRLHASLSFLLWEVQKYNDSKKLSSWMCVGGDRTYYALIIIYHKLLLDQR